jgi:8-oxo-dGTP pyrophosphatase MutT (NUDIX family)
VNRERVRRIITRYEKQPIDGRHLVPSAVLIPLLYKDGELHVLLTERTEQVALHKGQVCFPGGTSQVEDDSLLETALREAWEETGLRPEDVELIGEIDDNVVASTGYVITPFVGFIPYPYAFHPNEQETKDIFCVPLAVLRNPERFRYEERAIGEYYYSGPVCDYDGHVIWGATARMLKHLVDLLVAAEA